jgi:polyhydroxybutyrate depolymerase
LALTLAATLNCGGSTVDTPVVGDDGVLPGGAEAGGNKPTLGSLPGVDGRCVGFSAPGQTSFDLTLEHAGRTRRAFVRLPEGYDGTRALPVVLDFHGLTMQAWMEQFYTEIDRAASQRGMAAVHPQGLGLIPGWNSGSACCGGGSTQNVDDVAFVSALIDALAQELCIDPRRIYATGMSNGGFFSYALACGLADRLAAVAPVAGVNLMIDDCKPKRAIPLLHFHGTKDTLVPYQGSAIFGWPSAPDSAAQFAKLNRCAKGSTVSYAKGDVRCERWSDCEQGADVEFCTVQDGGHSWPGAIKLPIPWLGHTTSDIDATETILDFFEAHPKPGL